MVEMFGSRPGSYINLAGESRIPRRDGSTTIIPSDYWKSMELDVIQSYNQLPDLVENVTFCVANNDEVLGKTDFGELDSRIDVLGLDGNHDFTGSTRAGVIKLINEILTV